MIRTAIITEQPPAGKYTEQIFEAPTSTDRWTWVKFEDEDYNEFYGQFRGAPNSVGISHKHSTCYVVTSHYLYVIDCQNPANYTAQDFWDCGYTLKNFTVTPNGDPIFSDDYVIFTIGSSFEHQTILDTPIPVDMIQFQHWDNELLHISCEEFLVGTAVNLVLEADTMKIRFKRNDE